ncbi:MAG TPA: primosomal protein N' [Bacilli bacterium]
MYAKVIVDVPVKQTNRAFDYRVPESMEKLIEIGSRVGVTFGPRVIQGFVVDLIDSSDIENSKIKEITQILDLHPPLTKELVQLSGWMRDAYLCYEIKALQLMVPGALKAKYERSISLDLFVYSASQTAFTVKQQELLNYINSKGSVVLEVLLELYPDHGPFVKEMVRSGLMLESHLIKDRLAKKKVLTVYPPENIKLLAVYLGELSVKAHRQQQVLRYLMDHNRPIALTKLMLELEVGAGTVKGLADKGWLQLKEVEVFRDPYDHHNYPQTGPLLLTDEQTQVFQQIKSSLIKHRHQVFLLHGVTGSGKTEVYMQSIQECLDLGKEAIVLVPEISLTPQMVERFKGRFGNLVAVLHSRLSQGERYDEWRKIQLQKVKVAIGARSAVFAPFQQLGLLIIDEEHESSYKQEDSPKYHAREVAVQRGIYNQAVVILGSATPSLESYHKTLSRTNTGDSTSEKLESAGTMRLLTMESRVEGRPLPEVQIIDMREQLKEGNRSMFSRPLHKAIEVRLQRKEQIILFLNRRGYSTFVMCRSCGYVAGCPHCDISLTYHQKSKVIRCHYCGYAEAENKQCPECSSEHIRYFGTGTQRVEEELYKLFAGVRVIRMDMDTTTEKGSHEKWLTMFRDRKADVLLGTQMVAKGLDFPNVTLVGVIAADTILNLPDFRAAEKTFQLMTQVAGRAGRDQLPGEVVIQTYTPEHYSIICASEHNYIKFMDLELEQRKLRLYPPFCSLISITLSHEQALLLVRAGESLAGYLKERWKERENVHKLTLDDSGIPFMEVLGPVASPIPRIKDRYRFQCVVKYRGDPYVIPMVKEAIAQFDDLVQQQNLQISVDVDPQMMM